MAEKNYVGVAPLTMVRTNAGGYLQVYAEELVPADITDADLKRLVDEGYLAEAPVAEESAPAGPPAKSASKGDWEAYARSQGATDADLDGKTKDDLVAAYGES